MLIDMKYRARFSNIGQNTSAKNKVYCYITIRYNTNMIY